MALKVTYSKGFVCAWKPAVVLAFCLFVFFTVVHNMQSSDYEVVVHTCEEEIDVNGHFDFRRLLKHSIVCLIVIKRQSSIFRLWSEDCIVFVIRRSIYLIVQVGLKILPFACWRSFARKLQFASFSRLPLLLPNICYDNIFW